MLLNQEQIQAPENAPIARFDGLGRYQNSSEIHEKQAPETVRATHPRRHKRPAKARRRPPYHAASLTNCFPNNVISLQNITLRRGAKVLIDKASATIHPGEKVALVGRNGAGKSTLFALLGGALHEHGADFSMPAHWRIAQVAQHMPETGEAATAFVLAGDERLTRLRTVFPRGRAGQFCP